MLCVGQSGALAQTPQAPTRQQVQAARDHVKADPNLGGVHTEKTLHFKPGKDDKPEEKAKPRDPPPLWLVGLVGWLADAGRLVMWVIGGLAVAFLVVGLRHWVKVRGQVGKREALKLPSHVRELDIRPESLPDHIGASARELWLRGEQRAALSLLYRGALSRLVHRHGVPIRAASTEGECVQLASKRLPPDQHAFVARLVAAWQLTVYGGRLPDDSAVLALCEEFDARLGASTFSEAAA
ncbi:MAG: DUF4129 domain-containing protein [Rubrivivax sp.]|nr:MAG: DUF4129 domain-containing protein [Rubrivivax sp.]